LTIGAALSRYRDAADKLVRTPWAQERIPIIANALLQRSVLTGDDIAGLVG
jgi:hypothetical protein